MPGKKKGKGKKTGKGKKGKGKKVGKKKSLATVGDGTGPTKEQLMQAQMWESRLQATEDARKEFRIVARQLAADNDAMQDQMAQTEKDTMEVVGFLKRESSSKDEQIVRLQQQVKDLRRENRKEQESLVTEFSQQINNLEDELSQKNEEIEVMNAELKLVKEFRKKRAIMQRELDELHEKMETAETDHQRTVSRMDRHHVEERARLQKESDRKVTELAQQAHQHAMSKLDDAARGVFRENVRLKDALKLHMEDEQALQKDNDQMKLENKRLKEAEEMSRLVHEERASQALLLKKQNAELQAKVIALEQSLTQLVKNLDAEKQKFKDSMQRRMDILREENTTLQQTLQVKCQEMNRVKLVAKRILDQRGAVEDFFLSALEHVQLEVERNRVHYQETAKVAYLKKMRDATQGKGKFPAVRTFNRTSNSTNSVFDDMSGASEWPESMMSGSVDFQDLSWEQKEQVLRLLFAKMNSASGISPRRRQLPAIELPSRTRPKQPANASRPAQAEQPLLALTDGSASARQATRTSLPEVISSSSNLTSTVARLSLGTSVDGSPLSTEVDQS